MNALVADIRNTDSIDPAMAGAFYMLLLNVEFIANANIL